MIVALIALQIVGLAGLYLVLRRRIERSAHGAAERNVSLLEDRIERLHELLQQADRRLPLPPSGPRNAAAAAAAPERVEQVMRLRRIGFSSAVIAERLAASAGEVELIVNLAADRSAALQPTAGKPRPHAT